MGDLQVAKKSDNQTLVAAFSMTKAYLNPLETVKF